MAAGLLNMVIVPIVLFTWSVRQRTRVLAFLGNNDLLQEHPIQKQLQTPVAFVDKSVYISPLINRLIVGTVSTRVRNRSEL